MTETWRLFIAVELPSDVVAAISDLQANLKKVIPPRAVKWVRPEGIHVTLKFLGDVPLASLDTIKAGMAESVKGHRPFDLAVDGLGCFPNIQRPRVLWAGVGGNQGALKRLQASIERQIAPLGYPTEERGFNPHLTLGRVAPGASREEIAQIGGLTGTHDQGLLAEWHITSLSLMRSQLKSDGAVYTCVHEVALASG